MNRREFLQRVGATAAVAAGASGAALFLHNRPSAGPGRRLTLGDYRVELGASDVRMAVARGTDVASLVAAALAEMGGIGKFVRRGDVVVIKANVAFDRPPVLGATTSPEVVRAIVAQCRQAGARKVVVADNPINQPASSFFKSGIGPAAEAAGAQIAYPFQSQFEEVFIGGQVLRDTWPMFYGPFRDADKVIGVAPLKDHNLCSASMTMKNWYGLLGGGRNRFHQDIHGVIADFAHMVRPTMVVLDATRVLVRNGPTGGSMNDVVPGNTVVAGVDMVAVDAYGYTLLRELRGAGPDMVDYVQQAAARGLGAADWRQLAWREVNA
jgi:uncharacterized protein (DUF362 family)